jgi:hypothetical protein
LPLFGVDLKAVTIPLIEIRGFYCMRERTDMPTSYSADPKAEKPREPWVHDCGSELTPQFCGDAKGFTQSTLTGWNPIPYLL